MRVAIVGAGPAGFYAAGQLLSAKGMSIEVDMFDRLATPWGLVRHGVAPDHPKIKSVTRVYELTAARAGFRYHGNVEVGRDVSHAELAGAYHAVLYATGAAGDRKLAIPGEELPGSHSASEFVAWYNGHPDHADHQFALDTRRAVVVGSGNVALDVARMLAVDAGELRCTDIADHAITALAVSEIEEIVVLARRGPAQASFTNPELRELAELAGVDVVVDPAEATLDPASAAMLESRAAGPATKNNVETIQRYASLRPAGKRRRIVLRFCISPTEIVGDERVEGLRAVTNELVVDDRGRIVARPTGETEVIRAGLVLRAIGYRAWPIPGVPFDESSWTIDNRDGRVTGQPGVYVAGWAKRGPSGVIGTNKKCAQQTVDLLLEDLTAGRLAMPSALPTTLLGRLRARGIQVVDYAGWELIDAYEKRCGERHARPRVKLVRRSQHLFHAAGPAG